MQRRAAFERIALMLGGTALSPQITAGLMGQVTNTGESLTIDVATEALLAEVSDVIIPETETPGAKEAGAHHFIIRVLRDCHTLKEQEDFYANLAKIDANSQKAHGKGFVDLSEEQQIEVMNQIVKDQKSYFKQLRQFVVTGYFTSEMGATKALAYLPIPGQFIGDVPMKPDQKTWAM